MPRPFSSFAMAAAFVSDMQHDSTYRIRGHLLDWDLFRRLRKRAQARAAAQHPGALRQPRRPLHPDIVQRHDRAAQRDERRTPFEV